MPIKYAFIPQSKMASALKELKDFNIEYFVAQDFVRTSATPIGQDSRGQEIYPRVQCLTIEYDTDTLPAKDLGELRAFLQSLTPDYNLDAQRMRDVLNDVNRGKDGLPALPSFPNAE